MTQKEKLIGILSVPIYPREGVNYAEVVADYLIENGVVVLPCKLGDTAYQIDNKGYVVDREVMHFIVQNGELVRACSSCRFNPNIGDWNDDDD